MEIIKQLMEQLQDEMGHSPDELGERLGRPKAVSIEMSSDDPDMDGDDDSGEMLGDDSDLDMNSPEEKLKARLLKMRG